MPVVKIYLEDAAGAPLTGVRVKVRAKGNGDEPVYKNGGHVRVRDAYASIDATGLASFTLDRNTDLLPTTSYYEYTYPNSKGRDSEPRAFQVPSSGAGPFDIEDVLIDPPGEVESAALAAHRETVGDHEDVDLTGNGTGKALAWNGTQFVPTDMGTQIELDAEVTARGNADTAHANLTTSSDDVHGSKTYVNSRVTKLVIDALGIDAATLQGMSAAQLQTAIVAAIVDSSPATLDTLNELAAALGDDPNFATTITNALAAKQALSEKDTDGGYVGRDADGDVGTESTNGADTASFTFEAANEPGSGLRGFKLDRSGFGNPLGFTLRSAGVPEWDVMALDNFTNDLIFVYEHGIGDQLRYGEGAHMLFGRSVISPADTYRFRIESSAADDAAMVDLLVLNGSTASSGGNMTHLLRAENATETVFSVMAAGRVGVGVLNPTQRFQVSQSQDATTQFLLSNSNGGSSAKISLRVQGEAKSVFLEVPSSTWGTASLRNVGYLYTNDTHLVFGTNSTERARIDNLGNMVFGVGALAAGATDGFPYIPTIPGAPTGTPTAKTGLAPIVIDTTNHKLSWHENGKWWSNQPAAICIFPNGGSVTATDMAAALTEMVAGSPRGRMKYDFTRAQQVRLTLMVTTVGSASAEVRAQYSTDSGGSWNYLDGGTGPSVGIASTTGVKDSGWVDLAAGAKGDVWLRLISINGDGAADPSFGLGHIHVR